MRHVLNRWLLSMMKEQSCHRSASIMETVLWSSDSGHILHTLHWLIGFSSPVIHLGFWYHLSNTFTSGQFDENSFHIETILYARSCPWSAVPLRNSWLKSRHTTLFWFEPPEFQFAWDNWFLSKLWIRTFLNFSLCKSVRSETSHSEALAMILLGLNIGSHAALKTFLELMCSSVSSTRYSPISHEMLTQTCPNRLVRISWLMVAMAKAPLMMS